MPNSGVAKLIGENLHSLPHDKLGQVRLMGYRPFGLSQQPQEVSDKVNGHAQAIGEGIVQLIESNGKTIVDKAELDRLRAIEANQTPGQKVAHGYCAHCGVEVVRLSVDDKLNAHLHRVAQEAAGLKHSCWS